MAQETTQEFAFRFNQAIEGHKMAPPTPFGRQAWVIKKLKNETGLSVSPNTMSKWFKGLAKPRQDNIRKIAKVLEVDEIWLAMGQKPVAPSNDSREVAAKARGGALALAGMLEMMGGRVTFPDDDNSPVDMQVNYAGRTFEAVVVSPKETDKDWTILVPEPVGGARVLAVTMRPADEDCGSACLDVLDITGCTRQSLGGYSVVVLEKRKDGKLKSEGQRSLLTSLNSLKELTV